MSQEPLTPIDTDEFQTGRLVTIAGGHAVDYTFTVFSCRRCCRGLLSGCPCPNAAAGALSAFLQLPGLLQPVIGHLADRSTLRWIVVLGPGVTATAMSLLGWAPSYVVLALLLLVAGMSVAGFHATACRLRSATCRASGSDGEWGSGWSAANWAVRSVPSSW